PPNTTLIGWTAPVSGGAPNENTNGSGNVNEQVDIPVGGKIVYTVQLAVDADYGTGDLTNQATVGGVTDPDPTNNTAEDTDKSKPKSDLSITKTDGQQGYLPGNT